MASLIIHFSGLIILLLFSFGTGAEVCTPLSFKNCTDIALTRLDITNTTFFSNKEDLDASCSSYRSAVACLKEVSQNCSEPFDNDRLDSMLSGTSEVMEDVCNDETYREKYLSFADCFQEVFTNWTLCGEQHKNFLEFSRDVYSSTNATDVKAHHLCSALRDYSRCSTEKVMEKCGDEGGEFITEYNFRALGKIKNMCFPHGDKMPETDGSSSTAQEDMSSSTARPTPRMRTNSVQRTSATGAGSSVLPSVITVLISSIIAVR